MRRILLCLLIGGLLVVDCGLIYGQDDYLDVKGNIKVKTLTFKPFTGDTGGLPSTPVKGELFYDHSDTGGGFINEPVYRNNSEWKPFLSQTDRFVATHIVAEYHSPNKGRAEPDYICNNDNGDCASVIQRAIAYLPAGIGGSVYLLDGTYTITTPIIINKSDVSLFGAGYGTVLKANGAEQVIHTQTNASRVLISQMMIDGNSTALEGIKLESVSHSKIDKVLVKNIINYGIRLNSSNNNTITDCGVQTAVGSLAEGIRLEASSSYNIISGNHFVNLYKGIYVKASNNNTIINNYIGSMGFVGVQLEAASTGNIVSANNIVASSSNSAYGIGLVESLRNTISDNTISSVGQMGIGLVSSSNNNIVSGNTITDNVSHGILVLDSSSNSITGNVISDQDTASSAADGIRVASQGTGSKYNLIASNYISSQPGYVTLMESPPVCKYSCWINITGNCTDNYLVSNQLGGVPNYSWVPLMKDDGTNNSYTDKNKMSIMRSSVWNAMSGTSPQINPNSPALSYIPVVGCSNQNANGQCTTYADVPLKLDVPILAGKAKGDILILEGTRDGPGKVGICCDCASTTKLSWGGCVVQGLHSYRVLGANDILELIWNGDYWLEVKYEDN